MRDLRVELCELERDYLMESFFSFGVTSFEYFQLHNESVLIINLAIPFEVPLMHNIVISEELY